MVGGFTARAGIADQYFKLEPHQQLHILYQWARHALGLAGLGTGTKKWPEPKPEGFTEGGLT